MRPTPAVAGPDARGNPTGTASSAARDHAERALWRMMSFYGDPLADLDAASAADGGWGLPHAMKAGYLLSLTEPGHEGAVQHHLDAAHARSDGLSARERAHLEAVGLAARGHWDRACQVWDELLLEHPRDALALQWAHQWDLMRGDATSLRLRPARCLPDWSADDPLAAYVQGLYAFGLGECNLLSAAEDAGRRALAANPRVPWAVHAVTHVLEAQGRFDEGGVWLRQHQGSWSEGLGLATHLWWHKALFRLEAMDLAGVLRIVDKYLGGEVLGTNLQRVDAAALLWRLQLLGQDMSAAFGLLLRAWPPEQRLPGRGLFNDLHTLLALLGSRDGSAAEAWVARCAECAMDPARAGHAYHRSAREAGLPLMRGLLLLARGDADGAAKALYAARNRAWRCGGSQVQRDLLDQTAMAAAAIATPSIRASIGRALLNERLLAKPATPLTRHWAERLSMAPAV